MNYHFCRLVAFSYNLIKFGASEIKKNQTLLPFHTSSPTAVHMAANLKHCQEYSMHLMSGVH